MLPCSGYPAFAVLLTAVLRLDVRFNGTSVRLNSQAAYADESSVGQLTVTLPTELLTGKWNASANRSAVLDGHPFRLELKVPSLYQIAFDQNNSILHPSVIPLNVFPSYSTDILKEFNWTHQTSEFLNNSDRAFYLDFKINSSASFNETFDAVNLVFPFHWTNPMDIPGVYQPEFKAVIVPYRWKCLDASNASKVSLLYTYLNSYNMTFNYPLVLYSSPIYNNISLSDGLPWNCTYVDSNFVALSAWASVTNTSKCINGDYTFSLNATADQEVLTLGPRLSCYLSVPMTPLEAGDTVLVQFTISHHNDSNEVARNVLMDWLISSHIAEDPTSFTLLRYDVGEAPIVVSANITLKDSLPLSTNNQLSVRLSYIGNASVSGGDLEKVDPYDVDLPIKQVQINTTGSQPDIPREWAPGQEVKVTLGFLMPRGTLGSCSLELMFTTDTPGAFPVEILGSTTTVESPLVRVPNPSRRRRASGYQYLTHIVNVGTVTNPGNNTSSGKVTVQVDLKLAKSTPRGARILSSGTFSFASQSYALMAVTSTAAQADLIAVKTLRYEDIDIPQSMRVTIQVRHSNVSNAPAYDVSVTDLVKGMKILSGFECSACGAGVPYFPTIDRFVASIPVMPNSTFLNISYIAEPIDTTFPAGTTDNNGSISYTFGDTLALPSCVTRRNITSNNFFYDNGITALGAVVGFITGLLLVIVIIVLVVRFTKCGERLQWGSGSLVHPATVTDYTAISKQRYANNLLLDAGQTLKESWKSLVISPYESIVKILSMRDKVKANRALDSVDIQATVELDKTLQQERCNAMEQMVSYLLLGMMRNRDITRQHVDYATAQLKQAMSDMDTSLGAEKKKAHEELVSERASYNRRRLGNLLDKQRVYRAQKLEQAAGMSDSERREFMELIDKQLRMEQDELAFALKLEEDEAQERLRKEFDLKRSFKMKEIQQKLLQEFREKSNLNEQQAAWLMKEHAENSMHIQKMYDDELCRQKLVLEEKLAKRRALLDLSDSQDSAQSEILNTLAEGQLDLVKKAKKQQILTAHEAKVMTNNVLEELKSFRANLETDCGKQEASLSARLSDIKRKLLDAKAAEQKTALVDFEKLCQQQQKDGTLNPLSVAKNRLELLAKHEIERCDIEIQADTDNASQLRELRDVITQTYKNKLLEKEKKLAQELEKDGMAEVKAIIQQHQTEVVVLEEKQERLREQQEEELDARLKKRRRDWEKRMEQEQLEKGQLREQEERVVQQLVNGQLVLSDEEREKIMREHEKNVVRIENSLTLNKLRHRSILEQKLADRQAKRMEELEIKQLKEKEKASKKNSRVAEEDREADHLELMRQQAEEKVALLTNQDDEVNFEEMLEKVRLEMLQQRAQALREQEDRLGGLIAQLQFTKAKEIAEIDERQRAINELKTNMLDELHDCGAQSDAEAEQCLEKHHAQHQKLVKKLDAEREKQEAALKKKLGERLMQREQTLMETYDARLKEVMKSAPNKIAGKLKAAALQHRQAVAQEEFRTSMEKEISQTLDEMKRQHAVKKARLVQELELRFIADLVKQGKLHSSQLVECLKLLFPTKTEAQLQELVKTMHDPSADGVDDEAELLSASNANHLKERIQRSLFMVDNSKNAKPTKAEEDETSNSRRPKSSRKKAIHPMDIASKSTEAPSRLPPLKSAKSARPRPNHDDYNY